MAKNLIKKLVLIGSLIVAGGIYSEGNLGEYSDQGREIYESYKASKLEENLKKEEKEKYSNAFYLTQDSLNTCIKQAYKEVKKWPKEFDKRLFRLMLKQESGYNAHARSKTGYLGLGQLGSDTYETFRPEKFATFKDSTDLQKELFNPVENISISLEYLNYISNFCKKNDPKWETKNIEEKRKEILACYNAGHGKIQKVNWDLKSEKLKKETRDYPEKIMNAYYNSDVKVKL
jgi:soluble lytic murein transglycosylase-like protein